MSYDIAAKVVIYLAKDVIVKRILKLEFSRSRVNRTITRRNNKP